MGRKIEKIVLPCPGVSAVSEIILGLVLCTEFDRTIDETKEYYKDTTKIKMVPPHPVMVGIYQVYVYRYICHSTSTFNT